MVDSLTLGPGVASEVFTAGQSIIALSAGELGGFVVNPQLAVDQGIADAEVLFVDPTGPASLFPTATTFALQPGQTYAVPALSSTPLWINAVTGGHRFTAIQYGKSKPGEYVPATGTFPPLGPTGLVEVLPSYLYQEYNDDGDLQAFVATFNQLSQNYVDTFNALNLPIYTSDLISGSLLDWVAEGIYGLSRPSLSSGQFKTVGPYNTYQFNKAWYNYFKLSGPDVVVATSDDIFKRILTWHLYKGDGKVFSIRWLKRRIMRFLFGEDGVDLNIDQTYQISVTFGPNSGVNINLLSGISTIIGGTILNRFGLNRVTFNQTMLSIEPLTPLPNAVVFKEAVLSGVLELPFQFQYNVVI